MSKTKEELRQVTLVKLANMNPMQRARLLRLEALRRNLVKPTPQEVDEFKARAARRRQAAQKG